MTCIIGFADGNGKVFIGGDSAGVSGNNIQIRTDMDTSQSDSRLVSEWDNCFIIC